MKLGQRARFVGRGRERALWLLGAAVLIAMLWAIAQQLKWPVWSQAVLAGLAAAVALIIPELRARFGQDDTRAQLVEQRVKVSDGHGRLLRVKHVGLNELGVHAARVQVPYIKRDQQDKLEEAVGPGRAVLVVGHSMSGKTRLAAEVVKRKFPESLLLFAESGKALRELLDGGLNPADYVVWLNELDRFLGAGGLDENLLNRLTKGRAIMVATIRIEQRETYRPQDKLRPLEWEVLDRFEKGDIANPVGHALVRAAVDWRRTGLTRPVSKQVLTTALPTYLVDRPDVQRTDQAIGEGFAWATAKINETVALLGQVFTGSNGPVFEAFDYLIDQPTFTYTPVRDSMWALVMEQAEFAELIVIGLAAYQANKLATAATAWRQAADKGDSDAAPKAAFNLMLLWSVNRLGLALGSLRRNDDSVDGRRCRPRFVHEAVARCPPLPVGVTERAPDGNGMAISTDG